ncbi:MAG TPA: hypothetical protein PKD20_03105 [Candidatus Saccharibacteria bacterium]|nr:hypothetical protein [Candidatus Saccharibacteria bacterium]
MGKRIKTLILALSLFIANIMVLPVAAVDTTDQTTTNDESMQTTAVPESTETTATQAEDSQETTPVDKSAGRDERLKVYKEKIAEKLTAFKERKIKNGCSTIKGKITSLRTRITTVVANRKKAYKEIGEKLDVLIEKLKAAGADTTKIETIREDIRGDLATLEESMNSYDTVLADLEVMDCEADPATFKSAVLSAREMQKTLREQAQAFRAFATGELKTALQEIRDQLKSSTEQTDTTGANE